MRRLRDASGLSQESLAERARLSHETIGALERGVRRAPQRETLALLIEALSLTDAQRQALEEAAAASRRAGPARAGNSDERCRVPNNLPHAINSFHGREREIAELQQQLQLRRVITIHGLGGSGKTRLALELARAQLTGDRFPDGIGSSIWRRSSTRFDALLADFHEIEVAIAWAVGKQRDLELGAELVASLIGVWARCCLGTSDLQVGDAAESGPLGRGIVDLLSVLQPAEVLKATQPPDATPEGPFTVHPATSWLQAFKARRVYRANDVIFRSGDDALELHYILDGVISLEEIGVTVGRHELLGEMAFVSPLGKRTATARCVTDVSVLSVGRREMLDLCTRDAKFRLHITRVITSRLMRDLERLRSRRLLAR